MAVDMICKVIRCGDIIEVYRYNVPVKCGFEIERKRGDDEDSKQDQERDKNDDGKRTDNLLRARQTIRHVVWCNQTPFTKFVTLTYRDTVLDEKKVKHDVSMFVQSMRRNGFEMKYLYVLEHQKNRGEKEGNKGCLHVHMLIFIDRYIPKKILDKCWKHGFVGIEKIDDVKNLGAYVCKYITKETVAQFGNRSFSVSLGLNRPKEECFYAQGYSDNTPMHPNDILSALNCSYNASRRIDYFAPDGTPMYQTIDYFQGTWKDGDPFESAKAEWA